MSTWASRCQRICAHWSHQQSILNRLEDKQACLSWHTILQPPHGSVLIKNTSWFGCVTGPQALRARAAAEPGQSGSEWVCVCACVCVHARRGGLIGGKRIFESRAMTAEGEACVRHVCFAFTPFGAAVCTVLFPEHGNTADVLMVHPPSSPWAAAQGPLCPYLLEMFRFQIFCCLDLLELGWGV